MLYVNISCINIANTESDSINYTIFSIVFKKSDLITVQFLFAINRSSAYMPELIKIVIFIEFN